MHIALNILLGGARGSPILRALLHTGEFGLKLFELEKTLKLEFLGIDKAFTSLIDDLDIREDTLDDGLEARVFYLLHWHIFKELHGTLALKDLLDDVNDPLNRNIFLCQIGEDISLAVITVDNSLDSALRLHEEVYVQGRIDIPEEVLVDRD